MSNLSLNKGDCCTLELQKEPEDMYGRSRKCNGDVNVIIATYSDALTGRCAGRAREGHCRLRQLSARAKMGVDEE